MTKKSNCPLRGHFSSRFIGLVGPVSFSFLNLSSFAREKKKMSADSSPTLSAPTLNDENSSNMTAASVVDTYVTTTLMQAPFPPLDDVEGLQEHQKLSKETATMWRSTTRRSLYQSNEDVIAFNNEFSQFYDPLVTDAAKLDSYSGNNPTPSESEAARKNIAVGLSILEKKIESNQASCEASLQELQEFQVRLDTDYSNLDGDHKQVVAVYTGDQGRVQQMQDQIDADKKAMSTDMTIIASGATTDVVGGLMVAVGVLGEFESGGTSTALVVSGLAVIGGLLIFVLFFLNKAAFAFFCFFFFFFLVFFCCPHLESSFFVADFPCFFFFFLLLFNRWLHGSRPGSKRLR